MLKVTLKNISNQCREYIHDKKELLKIQKHKPYGKNLV